MKKITIRLAQPSDGAGLREIYAPYILNSTASWEYEVPTLSEFHRRMEEVAEQGLPWLVATSGKILLGYAYASRYAARRGFDFTAEVSIYLDAAAHGHGAGRKLYTALLALLKAQGYYTAMARVTHPNRASEAFHNAMGFQALCCFDAIGYKNGQWLGLAHSRFLLRTPVDGAVPSAPLAVEALPQEQVAQILSLAGDGQLAL